MCGSVQRNERFSSNFSPDKFKMNSSVPLCFHSQVGPHTLVQCLFFCFGETKKISPKKISRCSSSKETSRSSAAKNRVLLGRCSSQRIVECRSSSVVFSKGHREIGVSLWANGDPDSTWQLNFWGFPRILSHMERFFGTQNGFSAYSVLMELDRRSPFNIFKIMTCMDVVWRVSTFRKIMMSYVNFSCHN